MTDLWEPHRNSWVAERLWRGANISREGAEAENFHFVMILWTWFYFQTVSQVRRMSTECRKRGSTSPSDAPSLRGPSNMLKSQECVKLHLSLGSFPTVPGSLGTPWLSYSVDPSGCSDSVDAFPTLILSPPIYFPLLGLKPSHRPTPSLDQDSPDTAFFQAWTFANSLLPICSNSGFCLHPPVRLYTLDADLGFMLLGVSNYLPDHLF